MHKIIAAFLLTCGIAFSLAAAERIQITANFAGDNDAKIEILGKSPNVWANKKSNPFNNKNKAGRAHVFYITKLEGRTEVMLKLRLTGDGNFCFSSIGWGAEKGTFSWFECLSLEINGEKYIDKPVVFSKWKKLTDEVSIGGTEEITMKAVFRKVDAERAAKLDKSANGKAKGKSKAKAKK